MPARGTSTAVGLATLIFTLLGWSSIPLFIAHFAHAIDWSTQNGWRYAFAAVLWAPALGWAYARGTVPRGLWRASLVPAVFNALGQAAFTWSYYEVDKGTATFGLRMQIVFLAVGAYMLFPSERPLLRSPRAWAAIALVLGGVMGTAFLHDPAAAPHDAVGASGSSTFGIGMAVLSGLLFAGYALAVRKNMHGMNPLTAFAAISQITALITVALMLVLARDPATHAPDFGASVWRLSGGQLALLAASAVIGIALGHTFYYIAIARLGVAVSSAVLQLQPFCVAMAQWMIEGRSLVPGQWACGTLAVAGAMLLLHTQWRIGRAAGRTPPGSVERETVPGGRAVGVEAAEMDAMPVDGQAGGRADASVAGKSRRHTK